MRDFMPAYPDTNRWSTTHHMQVTAVNPTARLVEGIETNGRPYCFYNPVILPSRTLQSYIVRALLISISYPSESLKMPIKILTSKCSHLKL